MKNLSDIVVLFILLVLLSCLTGLAFADTIVMKDGRRIEVDSCWKNGNSISYQKYGSVVSIPIERVARIEESAVPKDKNVVDFGFDMWKIGTPIREALNLAERYDIPIARSGLIHSNKHFNEKLCRPYIDTDSTFEYRPVLLGYPAIVELTFTPESRALALIVIRFSMAVKNDPQSPETEVLRTLRQKYGKPHPVMGDMLTHSSLEWRLDGGNLIGSVSYAAATVVTYKNAAWYEKFENEKKHQNDLKRQTNARQDSGRF